MSKDFTVGQPIPYNGQIYSSPIRYTSAPSELRAVRVDIDWSLYGVSSLVSRAAVGLNLLAAAVQTPLDAIRSVYIDNTFSNVTVYVQFPDTQFTIVCPPNYVVMSPAYTNIQEAVIYAEGFRSGDIPTTKLHFSSANVAGYSIPSTGRQPLILFPQTSAVIEAPGVNFNFGPRQMGAPQDQRLIVMIIGGYRAGAGIIPLVTSAQIGSVNATVNNVIQKPTAQFVSLAFAYAIVPTGNLQNVGVSWNTSVDGCYLRTYTIYNQSKNIPYFLSGAQSASAEKLNMSMDMPVGSVGIFGGFLNAITPNPIWTNTVEDGIEIGTTTLLSTASSISDAPGISNVAADPVNTSAGIVFI